MLLMMLLLRELRSLSGDVVKLLQCRVRRLFALRLRVEVVVRIVG